MDQLFVSYLTSVLVDDIVKVEILLLRKNEKQFLYNPATYRLNELETLTFHGLVNSANFIFFGCC
jgi:hypothetical protein